MAPQTQLFELIRRLRDQVTRRPAGAGVHGSFADGGGDLLQLVTDSLPVLVSFIDAEERYRFVNATYEQWFGHSKANVLGRTVREVLGADAYAVIQPHVRAALAGEMVRFESEVPYSAGGTRTIEATYVAQRIPDGTIAGYIALVSDISERKHFESGRAAAAARTEKLLRITSAIADAITNAEVFEALVDRVAEALGASSSGLWLIEDGRTVRLARGYGYAEAALKKLAAVPLDLTPSLPILDAIKRGQPLWFPSQAAMLEEYPHLSSLITHRRYRVSCLPLLVHGRVLGTLAVTIAEEREPSEEERDFLRLVAGYASQAVERLRLLEAERHSRAQADAAASRLRTLSHASRAIAESDLALDTRLRCVAGELASALGGCINVGLLDASGQLRAAAVHPPHPEAQLPGGATISAPLRVGARTLGMVTATRVNAGETYSADDHELLGELAERAAVAIDNSWLYQETLAARSRAEQLYRFAQAVVAADRVELVYDAALAAIERALDVPRSAILSFDDDGVLRFRAWRGVSEAYRTAVDGHTPWPADARSFEPVLVEDLEHAAALADREQLFRSERIRAVAFIPLVIGSHLLGKLAVYHAEPHVFADGELETLRSIANHLASVMARFNAAEKLGRSEHELRQRMEELAEADRRKDDFLATLAHELRNPLAPMRNAIEIQKLDGADNPKLAWSRDVIDRQLLHMTRLLEDLLDVSRVSRDKLQLRKRSVQIREILEAALETSRPLLDASQHTLTLTVPDEPVWVDGDVVRLAQVFANLLNNAAKYTPSSGRINLTVETRDDWVCVRLRDNGIGIDPKLLPNVFEIFVQAAAGRSQGGLGIGLSLVQGLVALHGGRVSAYSPGLGHGSEFVVELPLLKTLRSSVPSPPSTQQRSERVLVVDDNRDSAETMAMLCEVMGNTVETAFGGEQAITAGARFEPTVILLDLGMPELDGFEVCRRARAERWGRGAFIIAMTGWGQDDDRRRTREAGFDAHLVKPVDPAQLIDLLTQRSAATVGAEPRCGSSFE